MKESLFNQIFNETVKRDLGLGIQLKKKKPDAIRKWKNIKQTRWK
jgi:hypothetical protein